MAHLLSLKMCSADLTREWHATVVNTFRAAGVSRRQVQNFTKIPDKNVKNVNRIELHHFVWNRHGKCTQISTNMPDIGWVIHEIAFQILRILRKQRRFCMVKPMTACKEISLSRAKCLYQLRTGKRVLVSDRYRMCSSESIWW